MLSDVRNRVPRFGEMLGSLAANSSHGNALDFAPFGEVGKLRLSEMSGAWRRLGRRGCRRQQPLGESLNVIFADAAARPPALYFVDINANLAGKSPHMRSCGNRLAMLRASDLTQLHGHGERCRARLLRLVGRQSLLFRLAFCANRRLKRQTRPVLSGNMLHRCVARASGFSGRSWPALEREDHLPNFDLLAFFYFHFFHDATDRRRNLHDGFIGF